MTFKSTRKRFEEAQSDLDEIIEKKSFTKSKSDRSLAHLSHDAIWNRFKSAQLDLNSLMLDEIKNCPYRKLRSTDITKGETSGIKKS